MKKQPFIGQRIIVTREELKNTPKDLRWVNYLDDDYVSDIRGNEIYLEKADGWLDKKNAEDYYDYYREEFDHGPIKNEAGGLKAGQKVMLLKDYNDDFKAGQYYKVREILKRPFGSLKVVLQKAGDHLAKVTVPINFVAYNYVNFEKSLNNVGLGFANGTQYPIIAAHHIGNPKTYYFAVGWSPLHEKFDKIILPSAGDIVEDKDKNHLIVEEFNYEDYINFIKNKDILSYVTRIVETKDGEVIDASTQNQSLCSARSYWKNTKRIQEIDEEIVSVEKELEKMKQKRVDLKKKLSNNQKKLNDVYPKYKEYVKGE